MDPPTYPYKPFSYRLVPPPSLYCTSLHLIPLHFVHFTSLYSTSLDFILDDFSFHFRFCYIQVKRFLLLLCCTLWYGFWSSIILPDFDAQPSLTVWLYRPILLWKYGIFYTGQQRIATSPPNIETVHTFFFFHFGVINDNTPLKNAQIVNKVATLIYFNYAVLLLHALF